MSSPEHQGVPQPENPDKPAEHTVFLRATHFIDGQASQQAYTKVNDLIRHAQRQGQGWGISAHYLTNPENVSWYVAVVGRQPDEGIAGAVQTALDQGIPQTLPEAFTELLTRHYQDSPDTRTLEEWLR